MILHKAHLEAVVVVVVETVRDEEVPVVLGAEEVAPLAQGFGRGAVFGVPWGTDGPGLGVPGAGGKRLVKGNQMREFTLLLTEESRERVVLHLLLDL